MTETPAAIPIIDNIQDNCEVEAAREIKKPSPRPPKSNNGRAKILDKDSNLQVLYEKKTAESYSLHSRYDESSISHPEDFRDSRWSNANSTGSRPSKRYQTPNAPNKDVRRQHSPDFRAVNRQPSRMSYLSYSSRKYRPNNESGNELPSRGIFDQQRRRDKARTRRSNSTERNPVAMSWDMKSMNGMKNRTVRGDKFNRDNRTSLMPEYSR